MKHVTILNGFVNILYHFAHISQSVIQFRDGKLNGIRAITSEATDNGW